MRAKKSLGQHFLRDEAAIEEIVALADVGRSAGALEIGPGEGVLTGRLAASGVPVVVVEKDARLAEALGRRNIERVKVVCGDALRVDLDALLPPPDAERGRLPVVVGNLPYNAASPIYRRLLELRGRVARMVLMFQREVAQRIVAGPGSRAYGIPSVITALWAQAWLVREVPPEAFVPRPKVHSAVILVEFSGEPRVQADELDGLGSFVARLFQGRRKTMAKLVEPALLEATGVDAGVRPEQVAPELMLALYRAEIAG